MCTTPEQLPQQTSTHPNWARDPRKGVPTSQSHMLRAGWRPLPLISPLSTTPGGPPVRPLPSETVLPTQGPECSPRSRGLEDGLVESLAVTLRGTSRGGDSPSLGHNVGVRTAPTSDTGVADGSTYKCPEGWLFPPFPRHDASGTRQESTSIYRTNIGLAAPEAEPLGRRLLERKDSSPGGADFCTHLASAARFPKV